MKRYTTVQNVGVSKSFFNVFEKVSFSKHLFDQNYSKTNIL